VPAPKSGELPYKQDFTEISMEKCKEGRLGIDNATF
jgi:hypothetical protein